MSKFQAQEPQFESHIRESFAKQSFMATVGAELAGVTVGEVEIILPFREDPQ